MAQLLKKATSLLIESIALFVRAIFKVVVVTIPAFALPFTLAPGIETVSSFFLMVFPEIIVFLPNFVR